LIDTGATYSVVTTCKGPPSKFNMPIVGITGKKEIRPFLEPMKCTIGEKNGNA